MKNRISITIDFELSHPNASFERAIESIQPLLRLLKVNQSKATLFVVGEIAPQSTELLQLISSEGHEVAMHGYTHTPISVLGVKNFAYELAKGKELLEEIITQKILGYRAPYFSLTKECLWATDVLFDLGFEYSSSVLPTWNPQFGYPGAPKEPFMWTSGLVELPCPVIAVGPVGVPLLGGAYLRLAPAPLVHLASVAARRRSSNWSYCHPYDFDVEERFTIRDGDSWVFSKLLFLRRQKMLERIESLSKIPSVRMADIVFGLNKKSLPIFPSS